MYNIGKSLSVGTRSPNFKKLVVRKSFPELKIVRTKKKVENHCSTVHILKVFMNLTHAMSTFVQIISKKKSWAHNMKLL
jgi:hypothetical protein